MYIRRKPDLSATVSDMVVVVLELAVHSPFNQRALIGLKYRCYHTTGVNEFATAPFESLEVDFLDINRCYVARITSITLQTEAHQFPFPIFRL
jgi:hypothetical protein